MEKRWITWGWGLGGVLALWLLLRMALAEWFRADDFMLLLMVQHNFDPWASLWPVDTRHWWAYRPLGTELYFAGAHALFGYHAAGFHLTTLSVHLVSALLLSLCARRLGLGMWAARLAGGLYLTAFPYATFLMRAATFHYQLATVLLLGALSAHLNWLRRSGGHRWPRLVSIGAFALGLLCNQLIMAMIMLAFMTSLLLRPAPAVADHPAGSTGERLSFALRAALPFAALAAGLWALERFVFKPVGHQRWFGFFPDGLLPGRLAELVTLLVGEWPGAWLAIGLVLLGVARAGTPAADRRAMRAQATAATVAGLWLLLVLGAAATMFYIPHIRYTFPAVAPLCLLLAAGAERGLSMFASTRARQAWLLALALLWVSWSHLWTGPANPAGGPYEAAYNLVRQRMPDLDRDVVFAYGAPGLTDSDGLWRYRFLSFHFSHLRLIRPKARLKVTTANLAQGAPEPSPGALVIGLDPQLMPIELDPARVTQLVHAAAKRAPTAPDDAPR